MASENEAVIEHAGGTGKCDHAGVCLSNTYVEQRKKEVLDVTMASENEAVNENAEETGKCENAGVCLSNMDDEQRQKEVLDVSMASENEAVNENAEETGKCENAGVRLSNMDHVQQQKKTSVDYDRRLEGRLVGHCGKSSTYISEYERQYIIDALKKNHISWLINSNSCWLDASMSLIAHNKSMRRLKHFSRGSRIYEIISAYDESTSILNNATKEMSQRIAEARAKLESIQNSIRDYLQPRLKCERGEPDSAFCCLLNLIMENDFYRTYFKVTWLWKKKCSVCCTSETIRRTKPIITLTKVNIFDPENPICLYQCKCSESDQEMQLIYVDVPCCLIFHFENGVGVGVKDVKQSFFVQGVLFEMTGVVTLEKLKSELPAHFVTYIREAFTGKWLECNDMNENISAFSSTVPRIKSKNVYILVYETSCSGRITNTVRENGTSSCADTSIPCIDISDDFEE